METNSESDPANITRILEQHAEKGKPQEEHFRNLCGNSLQVLAEPLACADIT